MAGINKAELPLRVAQGVVAGDKSAIADAYSIMSQPVMNLATRILKDRQLAEEVVQDTFIEMVEKAAQIREPAALHGWIRKVATNHCLMRLRSPWHARKVDVELEPEGYVSEPDDTVEKAFAELNPETRAVIWLHDVEGYTHKEIGQLMGKTPSFSKSQLARGYEKLLAWRRASDEAVQPAIEKSDERQIEDGYFRPTCAT